MRTAISPRFYQDISLGKEIFEDVIEKKKYDPTKIETKIAIYADRVRGWFLGIGEELKQNDESGFVILMICLAHLEGMAQYRVGKISLGDSAQVLKGEIKRVFTIPSFHQKAIDILVEDARHGLFHDCMTRRRIFLSRDYLNPIIWDDPNEIVLINPHSFLDAIRDDFERYIIKLSDPMNTQERENFEKIFDER